MFYGELPCASETPHTEFFCADLITSRATYFSHMNAVSSIFAYQLGPALASATMNGFLWLPLGIGIMLLLAAIPVIATLPSGLPAVRSPSFASIASADQNTPLIPPVPQAQPTADKQTNPSILYTMQTRLATLRTTLAHGPLNFTLLLASFFLTSLASSDTKLLPAYISARYHWRFASAGYLLSAKAVFNFVNLTIVVPALLRCRPWWSQAATPDRAHKWHAQTCLLLSVLGALAVALAPSPAALVPALLLYALGAALPVFTLSLLRSPALRGGEDGDGDQAQQDTVFSVVMLARTAGALVGAPAMAAAWVGGVALGGVALGMPFLGSAAVYAVAMGVVGKIGV